MAGCASGVAFGANWGSPAFPDWSGDTVLRLLVDSPWAKGKTVRFTWYERNEQPITYRDVPGNVQGPTVTGGSPVGGIGAPKPKLPNQVDLIFRWASALPVRQAKALFRQREKKLDPAKAAEMVEPPSAGYVLEIFGIPLMAAHRGAGVVEAKLRDSVTLTTKSGRVLRPGRVEAVVGSGLAALIHFPRVEPVTVADGEVECAGNAQIFEFRERFKLGPMVYGGRLEL